MTALSSQPGGEELEAEEIGWREKRYEWARRRFDLIERWTRHEPMTPAEMTGAVYRDRETGNVLVSADYDRRALLNAVAALLDELAAPPSSPEVPTDGLREALQQALQHLRNNNHVSAQRVIEGALVYHDTRHRHAEHTDDIPTASGSTMAGQGIEALRELSEAATPGPWDAPMGFAPDTRTVPNATDIHAVRDSGPHWPGFFLGAVENKPDAAFIVAAVNYVRSRLSLPRPGERE